MHWADAGVENRLWCSLEEDLLNDVSWKMNLHTAPTHWWRCRTLACHDSQEHFQKSNCWNKLTFCIADKHASAFHAIKLLSHMWEPWYLFGCIKMRGNGWAYSQKQDKKTKKPPSYYAAEIALRISAQMKGPFILIQIVAPLLSVLSIQHIPFFLCRVCAIHSWKIPACVCMK